MLEIVYSSRFKKDYKRIKRSGRHDLDKLEEIIDKLSKEKPLEAKHCNHQLKGELLGCSECHISPDWLLIYEIDHKSNQLRLSRTGSHSELFE